MISLISVQLWSQTGSPVASLHKNKSTEKTDRKRQTEIEQFEIGAKVFQHQGERKKRRGKKGKEIEKRGRKR